MTVVTEIKTAIPEVLVEDCTIWISKGEVELAEYL